MHAWITSSISRETEKTFLYKINMYFLVQQKPTRFILPRAEVCRRVRQLRVYREHRRAINTIRLGRQRLRFPRKRYCRALEKIRERA